MPAIRLIVGLGNPGARYQRTRHNAGFWLVDALAQKHGIALRVDAKFHGEIGKTALHGQELWLLKPTTYMNRSGEAVRALANFYKIDAESILVAHDELDVPVGAVKLKRGGGNAGHNGLKDIDAQVGNNFIRLRIGIGRPTDTRPVVDYVLDDPSSAERARIDDVIRECIQTLPLMLEGELHKAMNHLHSIKPPAHEE